MKLKVFYAGDSEIGGSANYLFGALKHGGFEVSHLPPDQELRPSMLRRGRFDSVILSDFPKKSCPRESQQAIWDLVRSGAGFMMVGGWASFSGPFGLWRGSLVEDILPVQCLDRDDRTNFFSGAAVQVKANHPGLDPKIFKKTPVICGLNQVRIKRNGKLLLAAKPVRIQQSGGRIKTSFDKTDFPLLAVDQNPEKRVAAFMSDFAPHWCGGLVDWGDKILKVPVTPKIQIQVGENYCRFIAGLTRWLCGK